MEDLFSHSFSYDSVSENIQTMKQTKVFIAFFQERFQLVGEKVLFKVERERERGEREAMVSIGERESGREERENKQ